MDTWQTTKRNSFGCAHKGIGYLLIRRGRGFTTRKANSNPAVTPWRNFGRAKMTSFHNNVLTANTLNTSNPNPVYHIHTQRSDLWTADKILSYHAHPHDSCCILSLSCVFFRFKRSSLSWEEVMMDLKQPGLL